MTKQSTEHIGRDAEPIDVDLADIRAHDIREHDIREHDIREHDIREHDACQPIAHLEIERLRAKIGMQLFEQPLEPVRLGRFVLLDRLGQGGMGVVYSAYDPELDRKVALKLLASDDDPQSRERMQREAQALARLTHPHVVSVHDVGVVDKRVFIVMEFIDGSHLDAWLASTNRSWRDILAVYQQAGCGLVAAHEVGLVHRDFKPQNALIGDDGRVRVVDFGLARGTGLDRESTTRRQPTEIDDAVHTATASGRLEVALTKTGTLVGTPAYMAPEQFTLGDIGQHTDQFSFCIALYRALYGQHPFNGATVTELRDQICAGAIRPCPRGHDAPGWIEPIIRRGLSVRPQDRYSSMSALLAALDRNPQRTRRRIGALALVLAAAFAGLVWMFTRAQSAPPCQGADDDIATIWGREHRLAIGSQLSDSAHPYTTTAWQRISHGLDEYASSWASQSRNACMAHRSGRQSTRVLDLRMACLDHRRAALDTTVLLLTDMRPHQLDRALELVSKLPTLSQCGDIAALTAQVPIPEDLDVKHQVTAARQQLSRAAVLIDAGHYDRAIEMAATVNAHANVLAYTPLRAESQLIHGRALMADAGRQSKARTPLRRAVLLGLSAGAMPVAIEALARQIYVDALNQDSDTTERSATDFELAQALVEGTPNTDFVHALLLNNIGTAYLSRRQPDQARAYLQRARGVLQTNPRLDDFLELQVIWSNLALVTESWTERASLVQHAVDRLSRQLGVEHPRTLSQQMILGHQTVAPGRAVAIIEPTCERYRRYHPRLWREYTWCANFLALLHGELGNAATAVTWLSYIERAPFNEDQTIADSTEVRLATAFAAWYRGDPQSALSAFSALQRELDREPANLWTDASIAACALGVGVSALALERFDVAIGQLERTIHVLQRLQTSVRDVEHAQRLAWARRALAQALWEQARTNNERQRVAERVTTLLEQVRNWYRLSPNDYRARLRDLDG